MSGGLVLALQVRSETNRPRTTITRALHHLPYRLHDVGDDGIVHIDALRQIFHQRHHLLTNYRRAPQAHKGPHDFNVHPHRGFAAKDTYAYVTTATAQRQHSIQRLDSDVSVPDGKSVILQADVALTRELLDGYFELVL